VACKHGRTEIVEKLLNRDADWKIRRKGVSPLLVASKYGNLAIVQKLLDRGIPLETCDDLLRTAIHYAAWGGRACARVGASAEVARWLVEEKGMKEDERDALGFTPMCYAAESDNLEVLKFLEKRRGGLEEKRDEKRDGKKEKREEDGPSLLSLAVQGEAVGVIRYLSERGVKIEEKETLHKAARYHPRMVEELVRVGLVDEERANERDEDGNTPLHLIFSEMEFSEEMLRSVRALVRAGADINAKDELEKTVITKWVGGTMYNPEMLERGWEELQKMGADVNEGGALRMYAEAKRAVLQIGDG
jgi:ankyrin repeat protein